MIDGALRTMIDEVLISARKMFATVVASGHVKRHLRGIMLAPTDSLFDQSILTDRAERPWGPAFRGRTSSNLQPSA